jgi:hypothetical protein
MYYYQPLHVLQPYPHLLLPAFASNTTNLCMYYPTRMCCPNLSPRLCSFTASSAHLQCNIAGGYCTKSWRTGACWTINAGRTRPTNTQTLTVKWEDTETLILHNILGEKPSTFDNWKRIGSLVFWKRLTVRSHTTIYMCFERQEFCKSVHHCHNKVRLSTLRLSVDLVSTNLYFQVATMNCVLCLQIDAALCSDLKLLYVLITRAKHCVLFHEENPEMVSDGLSCHDKSSYQLKHEFWASNNRQIRRFVHAIDI